MRSATAALFTIVVTLTAACGSDSSDGQAADAQASHDAAPDPLAGWCSSQPTNFSFFVTSMNALWALSGDPISDLNGGFGGNLGGLAGADKICQDIAAATGHGDKTWRAFLSVTDGGDGNPVHAIERIGAGPWHDANGRLVSNNIAGLLSGDRPAGDAASVNDLPDECGVPLSALGDSHDIITGSNNQGRVSDTDRDSTCNDWTSSSDTVGIGDGTIRGGVVMCGHSFPRSVGGGSGQKWLSDHPLRGCSKGANLLQNGGGTGTCIGCSGGYGGLYCFAQ